jgi:hypothetical protein
MPYATKNIKSFFLREKKIKKGCKSETHLCNPATYFSTKINFLMA